MNAVRPVPPPAVGWITRTLEDAGHSTWAVGGAIRDALRERPSGDWDLATRATPQQVRRLFRRTVPIGIEHGTVGVLARDGTLYEVTTFRKDVETDGRHAVVEFAESIEEDLARRDFTINAIAWHPLRDEYADPFGGAADLDARILRTVGVATERFREDYLRILRALRFAGRFSLEIEGETWKAMCALVEYLPALSAERIREELFKVLAADPRPGTALTLYQRSGALRELYPELSALASEDWAELLGTLDHLPMNRPGLRLAAMLRPLAADDVASVLVRLRLSNALVDETACLAAAAALPRPDAPDAVYRRWLSRHGAVRLTPITRLDLARARASGPRVGDGHPSPADVVASWRRARATRRSGVPLTVSDLELSGRGLIALGMRPGPHFGDILESLLDWVLDDPARNERDGLEARALALAADLDGGKGVGPGV